MKEPNEKSDEESNKEYSKKEQLEFIKRHTKKYYKTVNKRQPMTEKAKRLEKARTRDHCTIF